MERVQMSILVVASYGGGRYFLKSYCASLSYQYAIPVMLTHINIKLLR